MTQPAATAEPSSTGPTTRNWLLRLAYDGTAYAGWQCQPEQATIQGVLRSCLKKLFDAGEPDVMGCSRTDAGVHALAQMVTAKVPAHPPIPTEAAHRFLRSQLPADIRVLSITEQEPDFHVRQAVAGKAYTYVIHQGNCDCPFWGRFCWSVKDVLNQDMMLAAAADLQGLHDFTAFKAKARGQEEIDPHCELSSLALRQHRKLLLLTVVGNRFLYRMVRRLTGFLVDVGRGRLEPGIAVELLAGQAPEIKFNTAPAQGLFLEEVFLDEIPPAFAPAELPFLKLL